jgi:hypothetical protein
LAVAAAACGDDDDPHACGNDDRCVETDAGSREVEPALPDARVSVKDASVTPDADVPRADASARDAAAPAVHDAGGGDAGTDDFEALRRTCLDTINMYRASKNLGPMMRPSAASESCSDDGAEFDSLANKAHGSAAKGAIPCRTAAVAQNACPNWGVSQGKTVADALKQCLMQMWNEGEPAEGIDACTQAYFKGDTACFLAHGHYINMVSSNKYVSCGFYLNASKNQWWMNQDFSSR